MRSRKQAGAEKVATIAKGGKWGGQERGRKKFLLPAIEVFLHNIFFAAVQNGLVSIAALYQAQISRWSLSKIVALAVWRTTWLFDASVAVFISSSFNSIFVG